MRQVWCQKTVMETYWQLLGDINHWLFELTLQFIFDVLIGLFLWPIIRPRLQGWAIHHKSDDQKIADLEKELKAIKERIGL